MSVLIGGYGRLEKLSFAPCNKSGRLIWTAEHYKARIGHHLERNLFRIYKRIFFLLIWLYRGYTIHGNQYKLKGT